MSHHTTRAAQTSLKDLRRATFPIKMFTYLLLTLVFFGISIFSLLFVYHHIGERTAFFSLELFSYMTILKLTILLVAYFLLDGLRLFYILRALGVLVPFIYIIKLVFINIFVSNITPFATGGGFAQIYFLTRRDVPIGISIAATTIRTFLAILFFFIITPVIVLTEKSLIHIFSITKMFSYSLVATLTYFLILYVMVVRKNVAKRVIYWFFRLLRGNRILAEKRCRSMSFQSFRQIDAFAQSITGFLKGRPTYVFMSIFFTLLFLLSLFMFSVVLISGLNYEISPLSVISFQIIVTFLMYFTPTPGAAGVAEGGYVLLFSHFVRKSDIVSLTFAWRFFTVYIGMIVGAVVLYVQVLRDHGRAKK